MDKAWIRLRNGYGNGYGNGDGWMGGGRTKPTENGEDDHDEIKEVPRLFEVVDAEGEDLEGALGRKHHDEEHVQVLEDRRQCRARLVVIQRHREHVQPDEDHDHHVELFVAHDCENDRLRPPLQ